MKKGYIAVGVLFAIDVAVTAAFVAIMPDQVPVHFTGGEIDRIGSRFESFTAPALALAFGLFMMLLTRFGDEGNRATMMKLTVGMQAIFIAVTVFASLNILSHDVSDISLGAPDAGMSKIAAFVIGATLLFLGYLMPKATRNSAFGVRLPWTQKSDAAWQKGQSSSTAISHSPPPWSSLQPGRSSASSARTSRARTSMPERLMNLHRLFDCACWLQPVLCRHSGWSKDPGLTGRRRFFSATSISGVPG